MRRPHASLALLALAFLCLAGPALAQGVAQQMVNSIPDTFQTSVRGMEGALRTIGLGLLGGLVIIEMSFAISMKMLDGAGLHQILGVVVRQGFLGGLFYWLLVNAPDMSREIVLWFTDAGNQASQGMGGSRNLSPGDIVSIGLNLVNFVWSKMTWDSPIRSMILMFAGAVIIYCFAEITAAVILVTIQGYMFAAWAALMMGFGGSSYTRDIAIGQIRLAAAIGAERFVLTCIVGLGEGLMRGWGAGLRGAALEANTVLPIIVCPLIMLRLCKTLPQMAHSLIAGHTHPMPYGSPIAALASGAASAGVGVIAGASGAGAAMGAAYNLAVAQTGQGGAAGGPLAIAARTVGNLGQAAVGDVGARMRGEISAQRGYLGHRMAAQMRGQASAISNGSTGGNRP